MQCYMELTPPTAVSHSLTLPFLSADSKDLIVAKTSLLQIFRFKTISPSNRNTQRPGLTKLVLIAEYPLAGTITSLVQVKLPSTKSGGDALLVGLKDARLSLIEWDPERYGLSTISIHYYEQDELQGSPWAPNIHNCVNYLTADPNSRCAALKFGVRNLAILPFKQGDEDLNMNDDWDETIDGPRPIGIKFSQPTNGINGYDDSPSGTSYVIQLLKVNPALIFPIHLAFLHEYRGNPTFGILLSTIAPSSSLLPERRDHLTYMVFALDVEQRETTQIFFVENLPYDLFKVIPLPSPIEGALLVGGNELIHIDQSGKASGIAVNTFAKHCTSFGMVDRSHLEMRLEGSIMELLSVENGEMLIVLHTGALAILSFEMDGRSVSSLTIRRVAEELGGSLLVSGYSTASRLGTNAIFLGSEDSDSVVIGWNRKSNQTSRRKSRVVAEDGSDQIMVDDDQEGDEEDDDLDDDLYGESSVPATGLNGRSKLSSANRNVGDYIFRVHDSMVNIAPMSDLALGQPATPLDQPENYKGVQSDLQLVVANGKGKASSLAIIHRNIQPKVVGKFDFADARGVWAIKAVKTPAKKTQLKDKEPPASKCQDFNVEHDNLMIVSRMGAGGVEESDVFALTSSGFEVLEGTEFENDADAGLTIEAGTMGKGHRIVQVLQSVVRIYDGDLGLAQILDMSDEDTGAEPKIISASISDLFLLIIRDDSSIYVAQCDSSYEIDEIARDDNALLETKWLAGCLYADNTGVFATTQDDKGTKSGENIMMFLLSAAGALHIYALPDLSKPVYKSEGLCFVPPVLSAIYTARRAAMRETLVELVVADLGDMTSKSPYLIARSSNDNLTIYQPFRVDSPELKSLTATLHFCKVPNSRLAKDPVLSAETTSEDPPSTRNNPMRILSNVSGYSCVFLPGASPAFVLKGSKTLPKVISLQGSGIRNMSIFHAPGCDRGFIYVDYNGVARVSQFPSGASYDLGVALQKTSLGQAIHGIACHAPTRTYAVGTSAEVEFELPKGDEGPRKHRDDTSFKPVSEQSFVQLISPSTWAVIDSFELDPYEMIMCIKSLNLEVSEITNERRQMITVGTAITKGEDVAIKGRVYVFDVVTVVPEEGRPETNSKLKLYAKEEIPRGAVTAISEVGTQGFMVVAQGQKCMVRGVKEDGTILPVAFQDVNCYVTSIKELIGTGLVLMSDAMKGVWLTGYAEDPYRMIQLGKSAKNMEVVVADLLPDGKDLFIVVADADGNLHVLQYDPEHPKSLHGHLLLHRTTFSLGGHIPSSMTLIPRTAAATLEPITDDTLPAHQLLLTSNTGALSLLCPLTEIQYRKLNTLATALSNTLYHACGLNPRAYRVSKDAPEAMVGGRTVVDGTLLGRWKELSSQKRAEVASRVGVDVDEVREDLNDLVGGLGYL
ncbi:CPSF A subunit region-domain-containing protein [Calycina marina]|uniref:CPSF A subunit region-domain-containing protein n=1 Tax=Calycina marina TaxID=1763456 RepID=A0A9P8CIF3_9HELO|nr:CPSF A subunit region-domain-containing protein [Calycina marina]